MRSARPQHLSKTLVLNAYNMEAAAKPQPTLDEITGSAEQARFQAAALFMEVKPKSALRFASDLHDQLMSAYDALLKKFEEQQQALEAIAAEKTSG